MSGQEKDIYPRLAGFEESLERYFVHVTARCPYGLDEKAVYKQATFGWLDSDQMGFFLDKGFRRNGNSMYSMCCPECSLCVPIRLRPETFMPNRNQRRVLKKNRDVVAGVAPLTMSQENLSLLDLFLTKRFPGVTNQAEGYYTGFFITGITTCFEIRYRINDELVGVAVVDGSPGWLNAVYFYFHPAYDYRSLGTFNILYLNDFCRSQQIPFLYLGYWIKDLKGMDYKKRFSPHELFIDGKWTKVGP